MKVFDRALSADADVRRRLAAGALAASVLPDPHLAPVIASDTAAVRPWTVSTLVRGPSLADAVTQTGPLPPAAVGWTALGLARAIATLHRAELTHRAVTPRNVLLERSRADADRLRREPGRAGPRPGQLRRGRVPARLHGLLRGDRPASVERLAGSARPAEPAGDPDLAGCPAELTPIVAGCLAADPQARPSADRLVDWLATVADQRPRSWLPDAVAARLRDYQELPLAAAPASWPRFRRPR